MADCHPKTPCITVVAKYRGNVTNLKNRYREVLRAVISTTTIPGIIKDRLAIAIRPLKDTVGV